MTVTSLAGFRLANITRAAAVAVLGFFLMFVGHILAFVGWNATRDLALHLPYWWSYVLIYPVAGLAIARRRMLSGWRVAGYLCAAPLLYFFLLGVTEGRWFVSDFALGGIVASALLTGLVARSRWAGVTQENG